MSVVEISVIKIVTASILKGASYVSAKLALWGMVSPVMVSNSRTGL